MSHWSYFGRKRYEIASDKKMIVPKNMIWYPFWVSKIQIIGFICTRDELVARYWFTEVLFEFKSPIFSLRRR